MFAFPVSNNTAGRTGNAEGRRRLVSIQALGASALLTLAPVILAPVMLAAPNQASAQISISVTIAPPPLPVYEQPPIPDDGYIWTPGYWDYGDDGYYWVPGTWVQPPYEGALWTPGYWGYGDGGSYIWHGGYWGAAVGFYGGINYGYGYGGRGYEGGYWNGGRFSYNRSVNNINNVHITNVYNKTVYHNVTANRVSFNGRGGIEAQATEQQIAAEHDHRVPPTSMQMQHQQAARADRGTICFGQSRPTGCGGYTPAGGFYRRRRCSCQPALRYACFRTRQPSCRCAYAASRRGKPLRAA